MSNLHIISQDICFQVGEVFEIPAGDISLSFDIHVGLQLKLGKWPAASGFGTTISAKVVSCTREKITVEVLESVPANNLPKASLIVSVPRPQILKRLLEGLSYFPVSELLLVVSERTQKSYLQSSVLREDTLQKHLRLGSMQAGYVFRPEVHILDKFSKIFDHTDAVNKQIRLIADPRSSQCLNDVWRYPSGNDFDTVPDKVSTIFAIGPEAGWSEREYRSFQDAGFTGVKLADSVLRVDVAALTAMSQLHLSWMMKQIKVDE